MIGKLRRKFILTAMGALLVILVVLILAINLISLRQMYQSSDEALYALEASGGSFRERGGGHKPDLFLYDRPDAFTPDDIIGIFPGRGEDVIRYGREAERPFNTRYFTVSFLLTADGIYETVEADMSHIAALTDDEALTFAQKILKEHGTLLTEDTKIEADGTYGRHTGNIGFYRYMINNYLSGDACTTRIYFIDRSDDLIQARRLFLISVAIGLFALVAMFILVFAFSKRAVAPVAESLEKQKRFISDAGHELKTPLTVISADVDVLELDQGKNEWTDSIRTQTKRMTELIGNLLAISRMEEEDVTGAFTRLDLRQIVETCRQSFLPVAEEKNCPYDAELEAGLFVNGDADALTRLFTLLIDNALKYCASHGAVHMRLEKQGKYACYEISNPCEVMPDGNLERLFDRFYRADTSRNRKTGGYGLGLSAARAIAERHNGKIRAEKDGDKTIRFIVLLPLIP